MAVAVVGGVGGGGHLFDGDHAAFGNGAVFVFELDGGVADVEMRLEDMVEVFEDAGALGGRDVGNGDVAGEGAGLGAEGPAVEVVDVEHAGDGFHVIADVGDVEATGDAFEKDLEGFANDARRGPEDERCDDEREGGVDPALAREEDAGATGDDSGGGE